MAARNLASSSGLIAAKNAAISLYDIPEEVCNKKQ
jgi:hypothetical protein